MRNRVLIGLTVLVLGIAASAAEPLAEGTWTKKSNAIAGAWLIEKQGEGYTLKLTGFKTREAPDLKLFLSRQAPGEVTGKNATRDAVLIAKLKSVRGDQSYVLPAGLNPADFKTLVLHCEKFAKTWGVGKL